MRLPISWLREFVALPIESEAIADRLAMLGFPVAAIEKRPAITGVIAGKIATVDKHPNADRLLVARVDVAAQHPLTIATAATNVEPGQTIAVATIGASLPELRIEARTMRGVASQGMMISAQELALAPDWFEDGIMQLDASIAAGANVIEVFGLDTDVLDVEVTTNRPDAMCVIGIARELAASYGAALRLPPLDNPGQAREPQGAQPQVTIESPDCYRFVAQRFEGIRVGRSPAWMRIRLALSGQRPINNLVDVSNYVMLETGQPLHFYDADAIAAMTLVVRSAREGEKLVTLDGIERTLTPQALVVADGRHALGLAGVMGGATSEVKPTTTGIVLEAASFNGARVRRTSNALALRSEASTRHEKSLAPALTDIGAARAAQFLIAFGASAQPPHAFGPEISTPPAIALRATDVERLLGLAIPADRIAAHLRALGCDVATPGHDALFVTPPAWRRDLTIAADLVEEVARIEGYDRIVAAVPSVAPHDIASADFERENRIARSLAGLGYREVVTHSLRPTADADAVEVLNPLSEEQRFLRRSLAPGLIEYLATAPTARIFEIGDVFRRVQERVVEESELAFGFCAAATEEPWRDSYFLQLKGDCEALARELTGRPAMTSSASRTGFHPHKTGVVTIAGNEIGILGCIDPRVAKAHEIKGNAYLCILNVRALPPYETPRYRPPSRFPSTYRDVALLVDEGTLAREIEEAFGAALGSICTGARVFDEYRGPQVARGRKSLAVRVTLQRFDATITDEEADAAVGVALDAVRERFGATIRT